jgi:hypothetical protein
MAASGQAHKTALMACARPQRVLAPPACLPRIPARKLLASIKADQLPALRAQHGARPLVHLLWAVSRSQPQPVHRASQSEPQIPCALTMGLLEQLLVHYERGEGAKGLWWGPVLNFHVSYNKHPCRRLAGLCSTLRLCTALPCPANVFLS